MLNDSEGVLIEAWGDEIDGFLAAIPLRAPLLARIDVIEAAPLAGPPPASFEIAASRGHGAETRVTPDAATCPACTAEIRAPGRREGYAFTNCTHCGPRFSILTGVPYDRAQTTMAGFEICAACRAEYDDPADRRFHAQPIACPDCGPRLWFERDGAVQSAEPIAAAAALLREGGIVALKGLGGFHLACDAANAAGARHAPRPQAPPGQAAGADGAARPAGPDRPHRAGRERAVAGPRRTHRADSIARHAFPRPLPPV